METLHNLHKNGDTFDPKSALDKWILHTGRLSLQKLDERLKGGGQTELKFASADNCFK